MSELNPNASIIFKPSTYEIGYTSMESQRLYHGIGRWSLANTASGYAFSERDWSTYRDLLMAYKAGRTQPHVLVSLESVIHIQEGLARVAHANRTATFPEIAGRPVCVQNMLASRLAAVHARGDSQIGQLGKLNDCISEARATGQAVYLTSNENESIVTADTTKRYSTAA